MGKNNKIKLETDGNSHVLGIASTERIWKVCWEINRALGLKLASELPELQSPGADPAYSDTHSSTDFEYFLQENTQKSAKIPKIAQQFRFWLHIKPRRQKAPDLQAMINALKGSETISMSMDLTLINQEKPFLP